MKLLEIDITVAIFQEDASLYVDQAIPKIAEIVMGVHPTIQRVSVTAKLGWGLIGNDDSELLTRVQRER